MKRFAALALLSVIFVAGIGLMGCSSTAPNADSTPSAGQPADDHSEHADEGQAGESDMEKMQAELAKLSPEDAASAEKQHICPVSGKMLGTMGPPQKVDVDGQQVWICCPGCKDQLLDNPEEHLAKLKQE